MSYFFRIWEDFAALLNLLQVANPNLPEKIGKSKSWKCNSHFMTGNSTSSGFIGPLCVHRARNDELTLISLKYLLYEGLGIIYNWFLVQNIYIDLIPVQFPSS